MEEVAFKSVVTNLLSAIITRKTCLAFCASIATTTLNSYNPIFVPDSDNYLSSPALLYIPSNGLLTFVCVVSISDEDIQGLRQRGSVHSRDRFSAVKISDFELLLYASVSKSLTNLRINIKFILLSADIPNMLNYELTGLVLLLAMPWLFSVVLLVIYVLPLVVFVAFSSPVALLSVDLLFFFACFASMVVRSLDLVVFGLRHVGCWGSWSSCTVSRTHWVYWFVLGALKWMELRERTI